MKIEEWDIIVLCFPDCYWFWKNVHIFLIGVFYKLLVLFLHIFTFFAHFQEIRLRSSLYLPETKLLWAVHFFFFYFICSNLDSPKIETF